MWKFKAHTVYSEWATTTGRNLKIPRPEASAHYAHSTILVSIPQPFYYLATFYPPGHHSLHDDKYYMILFYVYVYFLYLQPGDRSWFPRGNVSKQISLSNYYSVKVGSETCTNVHVVSNSIRCDLSGEKPPSLANRDGTYPVNVSGW